MTLADHFPRTAAAYPTLVRWNADFEWSDPGAVEAIDLLNDKLIKEQAHGRQAVLRLATALREDLTAATEKIAGGSDAGHIAAARFVIAVPASFVTLADGLNGDAYSWVHWGASLTHDFSSRVNEGEYRLPPYESASAGLNALAELALVGWVRSAYLVARKFGGMDKLSRDFLDYSFGMSLVALGRGDVEAAVDALVAIVVWANKDGHPETKRLTRQLLALFDEQKVPPRQQASLAITFVTSAGQWTNHTPQQWAVRLLEDYRQHLVEHEVVQMLAVVMSSPSQWASMRDEILSELRKLARFYRSDDRSDAASSLALEARIDIIHPLIFSLTEFGSTDDILSVLWAWYGTDEAEPGDGNILFVAAAHGDGVTYVWPGGRWTRPGPAVGETLQGMMEGISAALTDYFRGPAGDRGVLLDERMVGAPAFDQAGQLHSAMEAHYGLVELAGHLPTDFRPRAIIVLPAMRDPFQAMLFEQTGWLAPMEASLLKTREIRLVRTISVWPGATQLTEAEVECIQLVGAMAGWTVKVTDGSLDEVAFQRFYEDPEPDVLWVIGHGEQSPYRIEETGILLEGEVLLPVTSIAQMTVPDEGRRLLVLNVCSSAAAQNRGGIARLGLGHFLASASQSVTAHLWPIDYYAALAFGCSLALALANEEIPDAFGTAIATMRDQPGLLALLRGVNANLQAADRLAGDRLREHLANLLNWGCPILLT